LSSLSVNYDDKVCVVGLGYIGLPTACLLASKGFSVHGVDINQKAVDFINMGKAHIVEPDLDLLLKAAVNSGRLKAYLKPEKADVFILAVPTPFKEDHKPDLSYVEAAVDSIIPYLHEGNLVLLESTSPVGTTEMITQRILEKRKDLAVAGHDNQSKSNLFVAYCPERVLPGSILKELINNDRTVGGVDEKSTQKAQEFYKKFVVGQVLPTNSRTAELVKLSENAFRDVNIAFANELSRVCRSLNIDVWELIALSNRHPRVKILRPGPGVGGHCIAVDPWFIIDSAPNETQVMLASRKVNDSQPEYSFKQISEHFAELELSKRPIALLGLAFKPNIDDLRESPAVEVVKLVANGFKGKIMVVEPHVDHLPKDLSHLPTVQLVGYEQAVSEAGLVVVLVKHSVFETLKNDQQRSVKVIDFVGLLSRYES